MIRAKNPHKNQTEHWMNPFHTCGFFYCSLMGKVVQGQKSLFLTSLQENEKTDPL